MRRKMRGWENANYVNSIKKLVVIASKSSYRSIFLFIHFVHSERKKIEKCFESKAFHIGNGKMQFYEHVFK